MTTSRVIIALATTVTKMMTMMTLMMTGRNKKKTSGKLKKTQARHVFSVFQRLTTFTRLHFNAMQREERGLKTQIIDLKMYIYIFNLVLVRILVFILILATIGRS